MDEARPWVAFLFMNFTCKPHALSPSLTRPGSGGGAVCGAVVWASDAHGRALAGAAPAQGWPQTSLVAARPRGGSERPALGVLVKAGAGATCVPAATVTADGVTQSNSDRSLFNSGGQKPETGLPGLKSRCQQGSVAAGSSGTEFVPWPFPVSRSRPHS